MSLPFKMLPFRRRPDLTPYLLHLTRASEGGDRSGLQNLKRILRDGILRGSGNDGYVKGPRKAACFMDIPFASLKYLMDESARGRYEPYGLFFSKTTAYDKGCRPVLHLSNQEVKELGIPARELWRVVRLEVHPSGWKSWLHEREWRCPEEFRLPRVMGGVMVATAREAQSLSRSLVESPKKFKCRPRCILPLEVVCQGLTFLAK